MQLLFPNYPPPMAYPSQRCPSRNNDILNSSFTLYHIRTTRSICKQNIRYVHHIAFRETVGGAFSGGSVRRDSRSACFGDLTRYMLLVVFFHSQCSSTPIGVRFWPWLGIGALKLNTGHNVTLANKEYIDALGNELLDQVSRDFSLFG